MADFQYRLLEEKYNAVLRENEILKEQVEFLENLFIPVLKMPIEWGFTQRETMLVRAFLGGNHILLKSNYAIIMYYDRHHENEIPEPKIFDVYICKVRAKFKKFGVPVTIETIWGTGYRMPDESVEYLRQFMVSTPMDMPPSLKIEQKKAS